MQCDWFLVHNGSLNRPIRSKLSSSVGFLLISHEIQFLLGFDSEKSFTLCAYSVFDIYRALWRMAAQNSYTVFIPITTVDA